MRRPIPVLTSSEVRKCTPPQMRTSFISRASAATLGKLRRSLPSEVGSTSVSETLSAPKCRSATAAITAASIAACEGYSGCIGVALSGVHVASRSVASLSSRSPLRIAFTGRQKL